MPLEVAERAVVARDIEAIGRPLERPPGLVPAVGPLAHVGAKDPAAFVARHLPRDVQELVVGQLATA